MKRLILLFISFAAVACGTCKDPILSAVKSHDKAVLVKDGWIRDPYIVLGDDDYYYLTGTTPNSGDERAKSDIYNSGLGAKSIVGHELQLWRSKDLAAWESVGVLYSTVDSPKFDGVNKSKINLSKQRLWAPELHYAGGKWLMTHCPKMVSVLASTDELEPNAQWHFHAPEQFLGIHDPSLFEDENGDVYMLWGYNEFFIGKLAEDLEGFVETPREINPADRIIGHEGATMLKIGGKYVYFGTAWSVENGRVGGGSYNLYYCVGDSPYGDFSERRFVGRFLGHGTPFVDKDGNWWCTAFFNGEVAPLESEGIETRNLAGLAQTINQSGTTIVPLDVRVLSDGDIYIRAKDSRYATPGPDELQQFDAPLPLE